MPTEFKIVPSGSGHWLLLAGDGGQGRYQISLDDLILSGTVVRDGVELSGTIIRDGLIPSETITNLRQGGPTLYLLHPGQQLLDLLTTDVGDGLATGWHPPGFGFDA